MGRVKTELRKSGWLYCFKRGDKAVFLNRKDQVIKEFKEVTHFMTCEEAQEMLQEIEKDCLN